MFRMADGVRNSASGLAVLDAASASGLTGTDVVLIGCGKAIRRSDSARDVSRVKTAHRVQTSALTTLPRGDSPVVPMGPCGESQD